MSADARLAAANRIIAEQVRAIARVHQLALAIMRATAEVRVLKLANQIVNILEQAPEYEQLQVQRADLLAALQEYVRDFGDNEDSDSQKMATKARAAIAKAGGAP